MRKYVYIGCGGFAGAILRYLIGQLSMAGGDLRFPVHTLLINVSGAFLLAFLLTAALAAWAPDADVRDGVTTGFLGAFTTFSTLCKEAAALLNAGAYIPAVSYLAASVALGLGAAYAGAALARKAAARPAGKWSKPEAETGKGMESEGEPTE